jgi:TolA-binding protein
VGASLFYLKPYAMLTRSGMKKLLLLFALTSFPVAFVHGLTVGIFDIRGDVGSEGGRLADLAQAEIQQDKSLTIRDRLAIKGIIAQQEKCAAGFRECPELSGAIKTLDMYVTGEAITLAATKQIVLRAVKTGDQTIAAMAVGSADSLEKSMAEAAAGLAKKIASQKNADKGSAERWKLAVQPVRAANAAAQKLTELAGLDSMLLNALAKRASFDLIETKTDDIVEAEKMLSLSGFAPGALAPAGSDYTHFVTATIQVADEARILAYQVVSKKTGTAIISDIIEWTVGQDPQAALDKIAEYTENDIMKVLGKLEISGCDPADAAITFEYKDATRAAASYICKSPLLIEDIPAGEYTLLFRHEDRNTLTKAITIKAVETLKLGKIQLPDIDMSLFQQASVAESAGKFSEANALYSQFYTKYPKHRMASYAMYREGYVTQLRLRQVADGRKILENVIARKPDAEIRSEAYVGMALGYKAEGDAEKSNAIFRMLTDQYAGTTAAEFARECLEGKCSL